MNQDTLADEVTGRITRMALQISSDLLSPEQSDMKLAYQNLLQAFPAGMDVQLFADSASAVDVNRWVAGLNLSCCPAVTARPDGEVTNTPSWIRDAFLRGERSGRRTYVKCVISAGRGDQANWISAIDGTPVVKVPDTYLDGGDSLVGPDFRLVGKTALYRTGNEIGGYLCKPAVALARLKALDTRPLTVVGYFPQSIRDKSSWIKFELQRRMQESRGSAPLAAGIPPTLPISLAMMRALIATITDLLLNRLTQSWLHTDQVVAVTGRREAGTKGTLLVAEIMPTGNGGQSEGPMADCLRALSEYLRGSGYKVINNPTRYKNAPLAYNNTIVQTGPDIVWLPQFSTNGEFADTDAANRKIWCDLGFEVRPVDGWMAFHQSSGAIRCATNVLERQ
ncbi:hypothetical protein Mesau_00569 [Mesorhizobium australicum WSM2073]|uniref:Uncharacterized protein n=1 Tax=Mesorhizobium australicum (strain HAMBI 3006 / LMG 24608 / WSM2073) TaxID=754035 RepID=L0KFA1_MESAW|nr:hypothetical protein [Mesorhizobium australicum]AGB43059.1 hypothetical protein Mesau_00569 [Mesorhizobium australicum WSM2073]